MPTSTRTQPVAADPAPYKRIHSGVRFGEVSATGDPRIDCVNGSMNCFCVTLYNEDCAELKLTLQALLKSLLDFAVKADRQPLRDVICVVGDGIGQIDPAVFALMESLGVSRNAG